MKNLIYISLAFIALLACNNAGKPEQKAEAKKDTTPVVTNTEASIQESTTEVKTTIPIGEFNPDNYYNNITSVLCGMKGSAHKFNYLFDTLAWQEHKKFIDDNWSKIERIRLKPMRSWASKEFATPNSKAKTVFYPFSGPDFLTAHTFFPSADKYIMLGLEPVGKLPELNKFKAGEHSDYSADFKKSLSDIFDKSYFITKTMLQDFQRQKVNGLLPVLAFFIKKTGHDIADVKYLIRYKQDSIVEVPYGYENRDHKPFGVRVDYIQDNARKSVYYFKYDVADKNFGDSTIFYRWLMKDKNYITYIKSASYLLHNNFMSTMRKMILDNSIAVIQDDTGIPYKYYQDGKWNNKLYGAYARPVSDFKYLTMQKPLEEAFQKDSASVGKLPFHLGYHWGSKKDVIIYALKK